MTTVEIRDDPDHPEGGHALIQFRGAPGLPGRATLLIEPLTEGLAYEGPRQLEVRGELTDTGVVYAVADGALDQLAPGVAVALSVQGSGIAADVLWPELTPLRIVTRRTGIRAAGPRRVVAQGAGLPASPPPRTELLQTPKPKPAEAPLPRPEPAPGPEIADHQAEPGPPPPPPPPPKKAAPTIEVPAPPPMAGVVPIAAEDPARAGGPPARDDDNAVPLDDKPRLPAPAPAGGGWRMPAVAAVAALAFCAGAAASGAAFLLRPAPPIESTALPSPYDMLHALPQQSPDGTSVDMADAGDFLLRSRSAKTPEDGSFWRRWAMRAMLETNVGGSTATLSDFAVELARTHTDPPTLAAARFLWELATLGQDCAAMQNIATALGVGGDKAKAAEIAAWQDREQQCRSQPSSAPN